MAGEGGGGEKWANSMIKREIQTKQILAAFYGRPNIGGRNENKMIEV